MILADTINEPILNSRFPKLVFGGEVGNIKYAIYAIDFDPSVKNVREAENRMQNCESLTKQCVFPLYMHVIDQKRRKERTLGEKGARYSHVQHYKPRKLSASRAHRRRAFRIE